MRKPILAFVSTAALFAATPAHAACTHAYFPSGIGSTWTYKSDAADGGGTYTMTVTKNDGSTLTIHVKGEMKDPKGNSTPIETDMQGTCSSNGLTMDFSAMGGNSMHGMTMKTVSQDGVAFLPAAKLVPGATWTDSRTMEMSGMPTGGKGGPGGGSGTMQMTSKAKHTVVGEEKVTVPAGTFTALKITDDVEIEMPGMGGPGGPMTSQRTTWLAKGVGIVKSESQIMGQTHGQELTAYKAK